MHLTQHILLKKGKKQHNVNFMGFRDPKRYLLCTTEALTLQFAFQKQAELIVCLSALQSTITQPETPQTCCKLRNLPDCCNLSSSCSKPVDFIKLQQVCEYQTCCNLIFADLLQVVTTTCSKLADIKS